MTSDEAKQMYSDMIEREGQDIAIRRYSGQGAARTHVDTPARAYVRRYSSQELQGSVVQGDQSVIMLVDQVAAIMPIRTTDIVVDGTDTYSIKNPMPRKVAGVVVAYELHTEG